MTVFDLAVIAILLVSILLGLWRGFFYEVLSLLGWPVAYIFCSMYADGIAQHIPIPVLSLDEGKQEMLRNAGAYVLVFITTLIVWGILVWMLSKLLKAKGLGGLNRIFGGLFGLLRGLLIVLAVVWLAGMTDIPEWPAWRNAQMSKAAEDVALLSKAWLPENIAQRIRYRARK